MAGLEGSSHILAGSFKRIDETIAGLVSSGEADEAAKVFDRIAESAKGQGISVDELRAKFPEYADALQQADADSKSAAASGDAVAGSINGVAGAAAGAKDPTEEIAKGLEEVGLAADGSVVDIDKFTAALFNAANLSLSASDAAIAYQAAIDAVTESVKVNGTTLDINTEQGRANQTAFNGVASAAMAAMTATAAETLATQGSSAAQAQLQTDLRGSYDSLIAAAGQFGITGDAADTLARKALGIPKETPIDSWVNDKASTVLDGIKAKADGLDGKRSTVTVDIFEKTWVSRHSNGSEAVNNVANGPGGAGGTSPYAKGGRIPAFWDGGRIPYPRPSDMSKDNVLGLVNGGKPVLLQGREWVINGRSSDTYDRELAAINAGTFPKLREYSAQQLGHAPAAVGGNSGPVQMTGTLVMDSGEVLGTFRGIATNVARSEIGAADAQSAYMRRGK